MNVDLKEVEKFNQLAQKWWDREGEFKTLHDINPIRLQFIMNQVDIKDKSIIDVGCGGGILTEALAQNGARVTGIDLARDSIHIAEQHQLDSNLSINYQVIS